MTIHTTTGQALRVEVNEVTGLSVYKGAELIARVDLDRDQLIKHATECLKVAAKKERYPWHADE